LYKFSRLRQNGKIILRYQEMNFVAMGGNEEPSRIKLLILLSIAVMSISLASILAVLASAPGSVTAFWSLFFPYLSS